MATLTASALLFGLSKLKAFPALTIPAASTIAAAGVLAATAVVVQVPLVGTGALTVTAVHTARATAVLRGASVAAGAAILTINPTADLAAKGVLTATPVLWPTTGDPAALLPPNASDLEKALAMSMASGGPPPVPVRSSSDPAVTDKAFLPFLAAHQSVDLWFSDWTEQRQRDMAAEAIELAALKGTREGAERFLAYTDGVILEAVAHPAPFVAGRARIGRTPVGHTAFLARYLVKVATTKPARAFTMRRSALGVRPSKTPDRTPIKRCLAALRVAKTPETEYRADFAHKRLLRISDAPPLDGTYQLGQYLDRVKL